MTSNLDRPDITVLVADDHRVYREGMVHAVVARPGLRLVAEAEDGPQALERIRSAHPDVAVLDVHMPAMSGTEVLDQVIEEALSARVLLLSSVADPHVVLYASGRGARGLLTKQRTRRTIYDAIIAVAAGEVVMDEVAPAVWARTAVMMCAHHDARRRG